MAIFTRHGTALADFNCAPHNRRATYIKPLFWQASETRANFYENPRQTSIEKTNETVKKSVRNALVKVSDPPYYHSAHTLVGDVWRGLTRRLLYKHFGAELSKTDNKKFSIFQVWHRSTHPTITSRTLNEGRWLGAPTHATVVSHCLHLGRWYVAWVGQASTKNIFGSWCVENRRQKLSIPLRWHKTELFESFDEERRTPQPTSLPLDHGCQWYLRDHHFHSLALPGTKLVGRGWITCRDRRSIVAWLRVCELLLIAVSFFFSFVCGVISRSSRGSR